MLPTPDHDRDHDGPLEGSGIASSPADLSDGAASAAVMEGKGELPGVRTLDYAGEDGAQKAGPPPASASPEEKELYWFQHVYQGDRMPQLTFRAILMGGVLGMLMAVSNLYTTIKLGWGFGVGITACVLSYAIWNTVRGVSGNRITPMSILENNCMQSTATTAGATTGNTVATAFGAMLLVTGVDAPWYFILPFILLTAALGCFLAIPMKRQLVNVEQLPFPSGIAAAETLRSLHGQGKEAARKAVALVCSMVTGAVVGLLKGPVGALAALDRLYNYVHIKELFAFGSAANPVASHRFSLNGLGFDPGVLMLGAGAFVGTRVCLSMLASSCLLYFVAIPWLLHHDLAWAGTAGYLRSLDIKDGVINPLRWGVWGGTAVIVFSSLTALATQWRTMARAFKIFKKGPGLEQAQAGASTEDRKAELLARMDEIEVPFWWLVAGVVPIGLGLVVVNYLAFNMSIVLGIIAVAMSWLAALVCCRASGETDIPPMGAVGKLTQLLYAVLAKGDTRINLMSAGITAASGASAADLLTDLKAGYLLGANPRKQFLAQFFGVFFGAPVVVLGWKLMIPTKEAFERYNPPGANMWLAMAKLLSDGVNTLPHSARVAIVIGALIGIGLPLITALWPKTGPYMPSAMGLGLGFVVPFYNSLSFAIGAVLAWVWLKVHKRTADAYTYPIGAGLIAGESIVLALIAMAATVSSLVWPK